MTLQVKINRPIWETKIGGFAPHLVFDKFILALESINTSPEGIQNNITLTVVNDIVSILDDKVLIIPTYVAPGEDFNETLSNIWGLYFTKTFNDFNIKPIN